jgi:hypothetical protein
MHHAGAQVARGRVVLSDSITGVPGAAIAVIDSVGNLVGRTLAEGDGRFAIRVPAPGNYDIRVQHLGFRLLTVHIGPVGAVESRNFLLVLDPTAKSLPVTVVNAHDDCGLNGPGRAILVRAWTTIRATLSSPRFEATGDAVAIRTLQLRGLQDRPGTFIHGTEFEPNDRHVTVDSLAAREVFADRLFGVTSTDTLLLAGAARPRREGGVVFDAPTPELIASDAFVGTHCFDLTDSPDTNGGVGLQFRPIRSRDTLVDVEGTIWLDQNLTRMRRLDFAYTNLQFLPSAVCNDGGACIDWQNSRGTGGALEFAYQPNGDWLVSRWIVRTPAETYDTRASGTHVRVVGGQVEHCVAGRDCEEVFIPVPRLALNIGAVLDISSDGRVLYVSDSAIATARRIDARQAGKKAGSIVGSVTSSDGRPLGSARVTVDKPSRAVVTGAQGEFQIDALPAVLTTISVRKPGYNPVGFRLQVLPDSIRHVQLRLVPTPVSSPH